MGLFDKNIKKTKDADKYLKSIHRLSDHERREIEKMAKSSILKPSGLSKKEFNKILDKADKENKIDHSDAYHIKKYGK